MRAQQTAPVLIVAFNRLDHFTQTLEALSAADLASETVVYVYIDGPRASDDTPIIEKIREYAERSRSLFASLKVVQRRENIGLATNITSAISEVVGQHGKIIVLEDDIIVSRAFLRFMNEALEHYHDEKKVWHIAAHTLVNDTNLPHDAFLWRFMNCWGWATWADRWQHYSKDVDRLISTWTPEMVDRFTLGGAAGYWRQVRHNAKGRINTWAVFWYATIFENDGLCLNPYYSHAKNIGLDGTGEHSARRPRYQRAQPLNHFGRFDPPSIVAENEAAAEVMRNAM